MARVPSKVMIYGTSGAGKSYLASQFDKPIFFDIENGLRFLPNIVKVRCKSYEEFIKMMNELIRKSEKDKKFNTVVIDSIDWLMTAIIAEVAGSSGDSYVARLNNATNTLNKSNGGYGNGKQVVANHVNNILLSLFDKLVDLGYTVVLIAHATKKDVMDADGFNSEQLAPKIDDNTMNTFVEWADHVLYLKNVDGVRKVQVSSDDNTLAKNRLGLNGIYDLSKVNIEELLDPESELGKEDNQTNEKEK